MRVWQPTPAQTVQMTRNHHPNRPSQMAQVMAIRPMKGIEMPATTKVIVEARDFQAPIAAKM